MNKCNGKCTIQFIHLIGVERKGPVRSISRPARSQQQLLFSLTQHPLSLICRFWEAAATHLKVLCLRSGGLWTPASSSRLTRCLAYLNRCSVQGLRKVEQIWIHKLLTVPLFNLKLSLQVQSFNILVQARYYVSSSFTKKIKKLCK